MEFLTDFISNNAVLLIAFVTVLAFIAKLVISYVSKDKTAIVPASEIVDNIADKVIDEIKEIKAENDLKNPNVKEGFQVMPKVYEDGSSKSSSENDVEITVDIEKMLKPTVVCEDGNIRDTEGNIVGRVKRKAGRPKKVKSNESETI